MLSIRWIKNEEGRLAAAWTACDKTGAPRGVVVTLSPACRVSAFPAFRRGQPRMAA